MRRVLSLLVLGVVAGLPACLEDDYVTVRRARGPEVEAPPARPRGCTSTAAATVEWLPVPDAPIVGAVHDVCAVGLGEHRAVIRLEGRSERRVTLVTLETEQRDPAVPAVVRRETLHDPRGYDRGTVRYRVLRFRQDRSMPAGRHLRVRLQSVDHVTGARYQAPPWPAPPAPVPAVHPTPGGAPPAEVLDKVSHGVRGLTEQLRKVNERPRPRPRP
jgi:hypothetical protein